MRLSWGSAFVFLLAAIAGLDGQEAVTVKGKAGQLIVVDSAAKGEVTWRLDKRLRDSAHHYKDLANKKLIIAAPGGTYEVTAFDKTAGVFLEWLVVIEGAPGPGPGPDPTPVPDTLATRVAAAYAADVAAGKGGEGERQVMQITFAQAGAFLEVGLEFHGKKMIDTVAGLLLKGKLPATMATIHAYLTASVPEYLSSVKITPEMKDRYTAMFTEVSVALNLGPQPPPDPTPIPVAGFKVLIVEETSKRTPAFVAVISSPLIRDYLDAKATKQGWRVQDQNLAADKDLPWVKELMARPRASVPWVVITGDGKVVHEGPLPIVSPAETLTFLKKFGG